MQEFLKDLLYVVILAAVPVLTTYAVKLIKKLAEGAAAKVEDARAKLYITEVSNAVRDAVSATSQTYVDTLKRAGNFTPDAQKRAAKKALDACVASISPAAQAFIEQAYGDLCEYLSTKIEAEVRNQKPFG